MEPSWKFLDISKGFHNIQCFGRGF